MIRKKALVTTPAAAVLLSLFLAARPSPAAAPVYEGDLPVFPGAVRDPAGEQDPSLRNLYQWKDIRNGSEWMRVFTAAVPPEEVFQFYRKALAAAEGDGGEIDLRTLAPGTVTPVWYGTDRSGAFLEQAGFSWLAVSAEGEVTGFRVGVEGRARGKGSRLVLWKEVLVPAPRP